MTSAPPAREAGARYKALDGFRFLAASLVVLYHYNQDFGIGLERITPAAKALPVMVDFFFVLSGFVIAATYQGLSSVPDYLDFLRRRVARLYPLHVATLAVFVALAMVVHLGWMKANHPDVLSFDNFAQNALLMHAWGLSPHLSFNGVSWSISAEWLCYLLFPVLLLPARRFPLAVNILLVALFVAAMIALRDRYALRPWTEATYDFGAMRALPLFFLGMLMHAAVRKRPQFFTISWPGVYALFGLALVILHLGLPAELAIVDLALLVPCAAMTERADPCSMMTSDMMVRLGDASYSLYMTHVITAVPVLFVLRKLGLIGSWLAAGAALGTYIVTVAAACVIFTVFETPMRRRLSGGTRTPAAVPVPGEAAAQAR